MSLYVALAAFFLVKSIIANGVSAVCENDGTISVKLDYAKTSEILELSYGSCNLTSSGVSGFSGLSSNGWNGTLDSSRCDMESNLRTLEYNQTGTFTVGRKLPDGHRIVFANFDLQTYCSYVSEYTVLFNIGDIESAGGLYDALGNKAEEPTNPLEDLVFDFSSYNSNFTEKQNMSNVAGSMINLGITASSSNPNITMEELTSAGAAIAPTSCIVATADKSKNYTIFDTSAKKCSNDFIELSVSRHVNGGQQMIQIQYRLFMFQSSGKSGASGYQLTCTTLTCGSAATAECKDALDCLLNG